MTETPKKEEPNQPDQCGLTQKDMSRPPTFPFLSSFLDFMRM